MQCIVLLSLSFRVLRLILNSGYCLCGLLDILLMSVWVSSTWMPFTWPRTCPRTCPRCKRIHNVCVHGAMWQSGVPSMLYCDLMSSVPRSTLNMTRINHLLKMNEWINDTKHFQALSINRNPIYYTTLPHACFRSFGGYFLLQHLYHSESGLGFLKVTLIEIGDDVHIKEIPSS